MADLHSKILGVCPPWGQNSFNFMQFWENLAKFGKMVFWRLPGVGVPCLGEILDPPLLILNCLYFDNGIHGCAYYVLVKYPGQMVYRVVGRFLKFI